MKRNGKDTRVLADGHPRRMADGKNAWRKQNAAQREEFVAWMLENGLADVVTFQEAAAEVS